MTLDEALATIASMEKTIAEQAKVIEDQDRLLYAAADALDKVQRQMTVTVPELWKTVQGIMQMAANQNEAITKALAVIAHQRQQIDAFNEAMGAEQAQMAASISKLGRLVAEINGNLN
jgi:uncharacterized coiled-coil protein SlyX